MRLTTFEAKTIKQTFKDIFVDGDIDLFIVLKEKLSLTKLMQLKSQFRIRLQNIIEEQKLPTDSLYFKI